MTFEIIPAGEGRWKAGELPLFQIDISAEALARKFDLPVFRWQEDGLGEACGFGGRTPTGLLILVEELLAVTPHRGAQCTIFVDAEDFHSQGRDKLVDEICSLFGLSTDELSWVQAKQLAGNHGK